MDDEIRRGYRKYSNHGYGKIIPTSKGIAYDAMKYLESVIAAADSESRDLLPDERRRVIEKLDTTLRELRRRIGGNKS